MVSTHLRIPKVYVVLFSFNSYHKLYLLFLSPETIETIKRESYPWSTQAKHFNLEFYGQLNRFKSKNEIKRHLDKE